MALVGKINTDLVARLNVLGGRAVGLNGKDAGLIRAKNIWRTYMKMVKSTWWTSGMSVMSKNQYRAFRSIAR